MACESVGPDLNRGRHKKNKCGPVRPPLWPGRCSSCAIDKAQRSEAMGRRWRGQRGTREVAGADSVNQAASINRREAGISSFWRSLTRDGTSARGWPQEDDSHGNIAASRPGCQARRGISAMTETFWTRPVACPLACVSLLFVRSTKYIGTPCRRNSKAWTPYKEVL